MSSSDWAAVDRLMRDLGAVRRAAMEVHASSIAARAIDRAIAEAAEAVDHTIDSPASTAALTGARDAIAVAAEVIRALDAEVGRALSVRARGEALRARAAQLIEQAQSLSEPRG